MRKKLKGKKGFTLLEILAVIIILGVLAVIAVVSVNKIIDNSREKAFFASVTNIVHSLKTENLVNSNDYCMYSLEKDEKNKIDDIYALYILAHKEDSKIVYSVYGARTEDEIDIDIYDFSKAKQSDKSTWKKDLRLNDNKLVNNSYTAALFNLYANQEEATSKYTICELG